MCLNSLIYDYGNIIVEIVNMGQLQYVQYILIDPRD